MPSLQSKKTAHSNPIIAAGKTPSTAKYIPRIAQKSPASEQMFGRSLANESIVFGASGGCDSINILVPE
jgi:hypothetical protein